MKTKKTERFFFKAKDFFLFFIFLPIFLSAQDPTKVSNFAFNGYIKDMKTILFQEIKGDWVTENLVHNRLNFKWFLSSSLTVSLELRNRFLYGSILTTYPAFNQTFEVDHGIIDLSKTIVEGNSFLLNTAIDRLWLQYSNAKFQLTLGRQRINWGQCFVWNPNDLFNTYSYFDFDYEEKPGSDAIRLQYYASPTSVVELAVKSNDQHKITLAALYRFNQWNYDFQFLGGIVDQTDYMIGTGWSGQFMNGGLRGELSYFYPTKDFNDTTAVFLASVVYDYTFKNSLFLQAEVLYNGNKQSTNVFLLNPLTVNNMSVKNLFLPDFSIFSSLSYPVTPLVNFSLAGIGNPENNLIFMIPSVTVSLKENMELSFTAQLMRYFGNENNNQDLNFIYARLKSSF